MNSLYFTCIHLLNLYMKSLQLQADVAFQKRLLNSKSCHIPLSSHSELHNLSLNESYTENALESSSESQYRLLVTKPLPF